MDNQNVAPESALIKATNFIKQADRLGFEYSLNSLGQVFFKEGEDWQGFDGFRRRVGIPSMKLLKTALISMGRADQPYEPPKGPMQVIDPLSGLVVGEIAGVAA